MSATREDPWEQSWKKQAQLDHDHRGILAAPRWHHLKGLARLARIWLAST